MIEPDLSAYPPPEPGPEMRRDAEWQRLDPRMLLVHPIREVIRFLPVLIVFAVARTAAGGEQWQLIGVAIPVALGLLRYLTTSFRINGGRIELKRGLLNRHVLSTPVDRVRTVDLTSSLIHRLLGLTKVRIGTGTASTSDEDRIDLDGLPLDRARALRAELLRTSTADDEVATEQAPEREVVTFDAAWVRFAPLTGSGVVIGAAALGAASQLLQATDFWEQFNPGDVDVPGVPLAVLIPLLVLGVLVVISLLSIGGYVVTNWGFRLTRSRGAETWHLTRGLFTTRETTLDDDRVAGVNLSEPIGLRLARGARLSAIVTGLDRGQQGSSSWSRPLRGRSSSGSPARSSTRPSLSTPPWSATGRAPPDVAGPARCCPRWSLAWAASSWSPLTHPPGCWSAWSRSPSRPCLPGTAPARSATPSSWATWSPGPAPSYAAAGSWRSTTSSGGTSGPPGSSAAPASPRWSPPWRAATSPSWCSTYPRTRRSASPTRRCRTWWRSSGRDRQFGDLPASRSRKCIA